MRMSSTLAEQYDSVRRLLLNLCWKMHTKCKLEFDDLLCEANWAFMKAAETFDASREVAFSTWVSHKVRSALLDYCRNNQRHRSRLQYVVWHDLDTYTRTASGVVKISRLSKYLSVDGDVLLGTALCEIDDRCQTKPQLRNALQSKLTDKGWTKQRINRAYQEVSRILQ